MTNDPYQPPATPPSDSMLPARRPTIIWTAVALITASFATGLTTILLEDGFPDSLGSALGVLVFLILTLPLALGLLFRRNWIRWFVVGILVLGYALPPWPKVPPLNDFDGAAYMLQIALQAIAVVLLLLPASGRWYRPNNSFKPMPLRGTA